MLHPSSRTATTCNQRTPIVPRVIDLQYLRENEGLPSLLADTLDIRPLAPLDTTSLQAHPQKVQFSSRAPVRLSAWGRLSESVLGHAWSQ